MVLKQAENMNGNLTIYDFQRDSYLMKVAGEKGNYEVNQEFKSE